MRPPPRTGAPRVAIDFASLQAKCGPKYLSQLLREVSTFLCYEATAELPTGPCTVTTRFGDETGQRIASRVGIVPVRLRCAPPPAPAAARCPCRAPYPSQFAQARALCPRTVLAPALHPLAAPPLSMPSRLDVRASLPWHFPPASPSSQVLRGGLGMLEAMTEMVSNAKVYHLGIYRDKTSLLPVEYYNKLPKRVDCDTVFVLDPCPISGSTAIAAIDILKAWGASGRAAAGAEPRALSIKFVCIGASEEAIENISSAHPDVRHSLPRRWFAS